uniref:Uncharacterized protein n=1 Tax=viral metagenome TaxID=1070528 RepID=A0A6C0IUB3_9ZZZZ
MATKRMSITAGFTRLHELLMRISPWVASHMRPNTTIHRLYDQCVQQMMECSSTTKNNRRLVQNAIDFELRSLDRLRHKCLYHKQHEWVVWLEGHKINLRFIRKSKMLI